MLKQFKLVSHSSPPDPAAIPDELGMDGRRLWQQVQSEYAIDDVGGKETLFQICMAVDMAARLRKRIDRDGAVIKTRTGLREHPALKAELAQRAFIVRGLQRLGLPLEPVRPPGRPPGY